MPCIYGFYDLSGSILYIGSTQKEFWLRFMSHLHAYYHPKERANKMKIIKKIQELGGFDFITYKVLEQWEDIDKTSLVKRERELIELLKPSCNSHCPYRFPGENNTIKNKKDSEDKRRVKCDCGSEFYYKTKHKHIKTHQHQAWLNTTSSDKT